ncbi:MAG: protein kinase, partial [Blastocatellia bacterium]|nr:protein kinase [Blastocatellia bacterium]
MKTSLTNGSPVGSYRVLSQLGAGGMGEVYLAEDSRLGRRVALKILSADFTKNKDRIHRFQQEARAASALNHPNIITIYEVGVTDATHFIAIEFIEGETLRERMMRARLGPVEVLDVAIQVASALSAAHAARIMHRDIKPENIMLRPDGYVKVLDFGLAKLTETSPDSLSVDPEADTSIDEDTARKRLVETDPGTVLGTVSYMSPEQARGLRIDARTDIFSLGVVMYEMIAGRVPFEGATISDVIVSILGKRPQPLARYSLGVPFELERIITKALAKDREERYQTVKDMLIDMKNLKQRLEVEAEIEYSMRPESVPRTSTSSGQRPAAVSKSGQRPAAASNEQITQPIEAADEAGVQTTSSAEYIISEIKRHRKGAVFALVAMLSVVAALIYFTRETKEIDSLAVMPFANTGTDPNAQNMGSLLCQRIINNLSQQPDLKVISFSSVSRFANQQIDPREVGQEMEVRAVLMGSVIKNERDDSISINIELVNARDRSQIWGKQYDRKFADLRRVQEEMLNDISERLGLRLSDEQKRLREAEQLYQEGRNYWEKRTSQGLLKGIDSFQQAIDSNPNYAPAYAGIADCYNMLAVYAVRSPKEAFSKAKEAAERAIAIDNRLAEAHTSLAFV